MVTFRKPNGAKSKRFARTLAEARNLKASLTADVRRGEYREVSKVTFAEYANEWIETYRGRTSRGIRPETMVEYKRQIEKRAIPFFGRLRLVEIEPRDVKRYVATVEAEGLSANTVRLALAPVKALFATARDEGAIRWNPADGVRMSTRTHAEDGDEEKAKALTPDELRRLLAAVDPSCRLLAEFLAATGLRISEAIGLRWSDVDLSARRVSIRRRYYRGSFAPPKSRYGRREVPLSPAMAEQLGALWRQRREGGEALIFPGRHGEPLHASTAFRAVKAAAVKAGAPWAGLHTLRHTAASLLFARGENPKQIQRWLGHHRASFTLDTYVHLLDEDLPERLDVCTSDVSTSMETKVGVRLVGAKDGERSTRAPSASAGQTPTAASAAQQGAIDEGRG